MSDGVDSPVYVVTLSALSLISDYGNIRAPGTNIAGTTAISSLPRLSAEPPSTLPLQVLANITSAALLPLHLWDTGTGTTVNPKHPWAPHWAAAAVQPTPWPSPNPLRPCTPLVSPRQKRPGLI